MRSLTFLKHSTEKAKITVTVCTYNLPVLEKFFQISAKSSATANDPTASFSSSSTAYNVVLPLWGKNPGLWQVNMESSAVHSPLRPDTIPVAQAWRGILSFKRHEVGPLVVHAMHFGILEQACAQSEGFIILGGIKRSSMVSFVIWGHSWWGSEANEYEHATPILSLCHLICTDWYILISIFFLLWKKSGYGPVKQGRQLATCDWACHSHGNLIPGKFDLRTNSETGIKWSCMPLLIGSCGGLKQTQAKSGVKKSMVSTGKSVIIFWFRYWWATFHFLTYQGLDKPASYDLKFFSFNREKNCPLGLYVDQNLFSLRPLLLLFAKKNTVNSNIF